MALFVAALAFAPDSVNPHYVTPPVPTYKPEPTYPQAARDAGIRGEVWLSILVDEKGIPTEITVTRSLEPSLDKEAIATLGKWRFKPAMKYGEPVAAKVTVGISFHPLLKN
jgi:protein TonB